MKVIAIQRDPIYSPNSVDKDKKILYEVANRIDGTVIAENTLNNYSLCNCDIILNMGRLPKTIDLLKNINNKHTLIINPPQAIENCNRATLNSIMKAHNLPFPPSTGNNGYWLKRADEVAQNENDIVFCKDKLILQKEKQAMLQRGITKTIVQAHIKGDLIKFYGVANTDFFSVHYPTENGNMKFKNELINGKPNHYAFKDVQLKNIANTIAKLTGTIIYGGDAIITSNGYIYIIDFNDWPSFAICSEKAADAIILYIKKIYKTI